MLCRDAACRVSPDKEAASQHPARLVKFQSWIAREQLARIAVAKITQEVRFPFTSGKTSAFTFAGSKPDIGLCTTHKPAPTRALCARSHSRLPYNVCLLFPRRLRRGFMERELCRLT